MLIAPAWAQEPSLRADNGPFTQLPLRRDADENGPMRNALTFLGILGVLAIATIWASKKKRSSAGGTFLSLSGWEKNEAQRISIVERRHLNSTCTLFLIRLNDEELLLGCTPQGISVLSARKVDISSKAN